MTLVNSVLAGVAPENVAIVVNGHSEPSNIIAVEYARLRECRFDYGAPNWALRHSC